MKQKDTHGLDLIDIFRMEEEAKEIQLGYTPSAFSLLTSENGKVNELSPFRYPIEHFCQHALISGGTNHGQIPLAMKVIEAAVNTPVGPKYDEVLPGAIILDDWKERWKGLEYGVDTERFNFIAFGKEGGDNFGLNVCAIPHGVHPGIYAQTLAIVLAHAGGLEDGENISVICEALLDLYEKRGILAGNYEYHAEIVTEESSAVTLTEVRRELLERVGSDTHFNELLHEALLPFESEDTSASKMFSHAGGCSIDALWGKSKVFVLAIPEANLRGFIGSCFVHGLWDFLRCHPEVFLCSNSARGFLVLEDYGVYIDDASSPTVVTKTQEVFDQAAGYGMYVYTITNALSRLPRSVLANIGIRFAFNDCLPQSAEYFGSIWRPTSQTALAKLLCCLPLGSFLFRARSNRWREEEAPILVLPEPTAQFHFWESEKESVPDEA